MTDVFTDLIAVFHKIHTYQIIMFYALSLHMLYIIYVSKELYKNKRVKE